MNASIVPVLKCEWRHRTSFKLMLALNWNIFWIYLFPTEIAALIAKQAIIVWPVWRKTEAKLKYSLVAALSVVCKLANKQTFRVGCTNCVNDGSIFPRTHSSCKLTGMCIVSVTAGCLYDARIYLWFIHIEFTSKSHRIFI